MVEETHLQMITSCFHFPGYYMNNKRKKDSVVDSNTCNPGCLLNSFRVSGPGLQGFIVGALFNSSFLCLSCLKMCMQLGSQSNPV